jgi:tRNA uracil 4-sulfurtransferase
VSKAEVFNKVIYMYKILAVSVDELWLKGKNRKVYIQAIKRHIKSVVKAFHSDPFTCLNENQRLILESDIPFNEELILSLQKVPGINAITPSQKISLDFDEIIPVVTKELENLDCELSTFKVITNRSNKQFPMTSMEMSRELGALILQNFSNLKVDVKSPEIQVRIKVATEKIYISVKKYKGIGGLPCGTSGNIVTMLSGGFDSPVASYLMSKRGCKQSFIFFYSYPYVGDEVKEKILEISKILGKYQYRSKLYIVPFGEIQNEISKSCFEEYRTLLFRKYMVDCANLLADRINADAICTGDALGQVSSQTIYNISAIDRYSKRPILRPLIGTNKVEIISLSKEIGTHDTSVIPHDDACALFAPKHPIIKPDLDYWDNFIDKNNLEDKLIEMLDSSECYSIDVTGKIVD